MRHKIVPPLILLLAAVFWGPAAAETTTIGNTKVVVKTVTGIIEGTIRTLELQDDVYHNEKIETGEESATQLLFLDNTTVTLGPKSELVLDRFVYNPKQGKGTFVMTATSGAFRFASGKLPSKSYKIHTPAATLGVRGTEFDILITPGEGENVLVDIMLRSGEVDIFACSGKQIQLTEIGTSARVMHDPMEHCIRP